MPLLRRSLAASLLLPLALALPLAAQPKPPARPAPRPAAARLGPGEYATFVTNKGAFVAQLYPQDAPKAVANFVALAEGKQPYKDASTGGLSMAPFYNGLLFFRSVPGQLLQTGDQLNDGTGNTGYTLPFEKNALKFNLAGRMALAQVPGDATSRGAQIFFTLAPMPSLDPQGFLIIGQIVRGLRVARALAAGPRQPGRADVPKYPNTLERVTIQVVK